MKKMRTFTSFSFKFGLIGSFLIHFVYATDSPLEKSRTPLQASFVQAKNRSIAKNSSVADDDDSLLGFDLTQDDPDFVHLAGLDIRAESEQLSVKMRHLSNDELRVTSIQVGSRLRMTIFAAKLCVHTCYNFFTQNLFLLLHLCEYNLYDFIILY